MAITGNPVVGLSPDGQALAAWPDVTRRRGANDGLESSGHAMEKAQLPAYAQHGTPDQNGVDPTVAPQFPTLATAQDPGLIFRTVDGLSRSQERMVTNRWAIDLYCRRVRANIPFSYLEKIPNVAQWVAKMPYGVTRERAGSTPNKADDLCNKIEATLEADPMRPNPIAHVDSEAAEQAGALCGEYLRQAMGESGINWEEKHHWAINVALTCGSAFLHYDVDPDGGGYQPYQVLAHPQAIDPANPKVGPDGQPTTDPVLRFVSAATPDVPAGQFVEDASQADRVWLPQPTCDRIRREQVRLFPPNADIESASAVILVLWCTLDQAIRKWPDTVGKMSATELASLASWRPSVGPDMIVPFALRSGLADGQSGPTRDEVGSLSPLLQRRMFYYRLYVGASREYADGLQLDTSGYQGGYTLGQKTLEYTVTLPKGGTVTRCRDIPLEQIRPCQDVDGGDPTGWAFLHRVAGSSETEQMLYAAYQDAINLRLNPHVFIRSLTAVDDDDWADRSTPIILDPSDPEPTYEQFSPMPDVLPMIENVDRKMDSSSGLGETGQNLQTSTAVSGVAKQITVQQANRDISGMLQQLNSAKTRGCRILCQIAQAEFDVPQLMEYTGEDGSVQTEWWTGENLSGIDDIGIEPGTGTTMTPEGKAQLAQFAQGNGWLTPKDAAKVGLMGVTRDLGLPADPVTEAIERAVGAWLKGPPDGWTPAARQTDPMTGQPVIDPSTGQPVMTPPSWSPFITRPNDSELAIAQKWMERLSLAQMSPEYTRYPAEWRKLLDDFYMQERQAVALAQAAQAGGSPQPPQSSQQAPSHAGAAPTNPPTHSMGAGAPNAVKPTLPNTPKAA